MPDKPKCTPGKWIFHQPWGGFSKITDDDGKLIFGVTVGTDKECQSAEICEANWARLDSCVAAMEDIGRPEKVKELIKAVKYIRDDLLKFGGEHDIPTVIDTALAALDLEGE